MTVDPKAPRDYYLAGIARTEWPDAEVTRKRFGNRFGRWWGAYVLYTDAEAPGVLLGHTFGPAKTTLLLMLADARERAEQRAPLSHPAG